MSGERILIIDDSVELVKHLTEYILPTFGYETMHTFDGQSGLEMIRSEKPDLVMLDYNLPEMTGIDVLQELAQEGITVPVILMTGYGSELSAIEAFRLGAKDYLIKPFTVDEVSDTIGRALVEIRLVHDNQKLAGEIRRLKVEINRLTQQMNTLAGIGKAVTSLLSVDKVLERVLEAATYLIDAEESIIWLPDEAGNQMYAYESSSNEGAPRPRLSLEDSQVGEVMRNGVPIRRSIFTGEGIKIHTGYFVRSVIYVPLKLRSITMGILSVNNRQSLRSFSKQDEFLLAFLADYAAIALENARVFQAADQALATRLDELNTLIDITRIITSSLDLEEVLNLTIKHVHDSWDIEASSLWLLDENDSSLRILANVGTASGKLSQFMVPRDKGFVGHVVVTGKWIYSNDVPNHEMHYKEIDDKTDFITESLLCVPLKFQDKVIGALELLNKKSGDFTDNDVERAESIADAVAIAVNNALRHKEAEVAS